MNLTGAFISEAIEIDVDLVDTLGGRCGRYPGPAMGGAKWYGIIADTNFPSEGTPWHERMENPTEDMEVFKQPSGLSAHAENLNYLLQPDQSFH
jgi:hypothetical protein